MFIKTLIMPFYCGLTSNIPETYMDCGYVASKAPREKEKKEDET
jgi:hypothetical protein